MIPKDCRLPIQGMQNVLFLENKAGTTKAWPQFCASSNNLFKMKTTQRKPLTMMNAKFSQLKFCHEKGLTNLISTRPYDLKVSLKSIIVFLEMFLCLGPSNFDAQNGFATEGSENGPPNLLSNFSLGRLDAEWFWVFGYGTSVVFVLLFNALMLFSIAKNKFLHTNTNR